MRYVVEQYSYWMVVALVLGLTAGWVAARQPGAVRSYGWVQAQLLLAAIGWGVLYSGVVRGAAGLWFETLVLLGSTYLAGCIVASLLAPKSAKKAAKTMAAKTAPNS
jgi:hypothetical protein